MNKKINRIKQKGITGIMLVIFLLAANAQSTEIENLETLDREIQKITTKHQVPSITYSIIKRSESHLAAHGYANISRDIKTKIDTPYQVASVSKMIVGIAIMQLVESGKLSLDDRLNKWLPELKYSNNWKETHPLKLVHLLENTTGWDEISLREFAYYNQPPLNLHDALNINQNSRTSRWPSGTRHAYTNSAATVAALIIEKATGMSYFSYVEQFIFKPLGISSASYAFADKSRATAYSNNKEVKPTPILFRPSGALSINLQDLTKIAQMMINKGAPLLTAASVSRIERSETTNAGSFDAGYGIFNYARYYDGIRYRGHDGLLPGWLAELSYSPAHKHGFVILQNSENSRAFREVVNLISTFLTKDLEVQNIGVQAVPEKWLAISGYYRAHNPRFAKRYFLERLISVNKLEVTKQGAVFKSSLPIGWKRDLNYAGDGIWQNSKNNIVMKAVEDPVLGQVIHYGDRVFVKTGSISAWLDKILLTAWVLLLIPLIIMSIIWFVKSVRGKYKLKETLKYRLGIAAAGIGAVLFILFLLLGMAAPITRFGDLGFFSIGFLISTFILPLSTFVAFWTSAKYRKVGASKSLIGYSNAFIFLQTCVVIYLAWYGVIGMLVWL